MTQVTKNEKVRYSRQMPLFVDGLNSQQKLRRAHVCIVGVGGIGSNVALHLVRAGIGTVTLIDFDVVSISNLHRQVLYTEHDIGKKKVTAAKAALTMMNSECSVHDICVKVDGIDSFSAVENVDIFVSALDNFAARDILNSYSLLKNIPLVHGAVDGLVGQVTFFAPNVTPCLRCVISHTPQQRVISTLSPVCGIVASVEALEVIKYITGGCDLLYNTLLLIDAKKNIYQKVTIEKNKKCSVCGDKK